MSKVIISANVNSSKINEINRFTNSSVFEYIQYSNKWMNNEYEYEYEYNFFCIYEKWINIFYSVWMNILMNIIINIFDFAFIPTQLYS